VGTFEEWSAGGTDRIPFVTPEDLERSDPDLLRPLVEAEVEVSVAGYVAEKISSGNAMGAFVWGEDAMRALYWLQRLGGNRYVDRFEEIVEETEKKLIEPRVWNAVEKVAEALLERKTLTGTEAAGIILGELGKLTVLAPVLGDRL
jgi:hypothetical protein